MADWQVGDLALCVRGGFQPGCVGGCKYPTSGDVFRVERTAKLLFMDGLVHTALYLADAPINRNGERVWPATRFRKITPGADIEGFEEPRRIPVKEPS